jgi:hypothetical protein
LPSASPQADTPVLVQPAPTGPVTRCQRGIV